MLHRPLAYLLFAGATLTGTRQKKTGGVRAHLPLPDHTCGTA